MADGEKNSPKSKVHRMVPVPEAIRTVLRETARVLLTPNAKPNPTLEISSNAPWSEIMNQVLEKDVLMSQPGYPPYNASIMDGYAIRATEASKSSSDLVVTSPPWTHQVVAKVYAGDESLPSKSNTEAGKASPTQLPTAFYITTGAVVPESFDCVVPIEDCHVSDDGRNIRIKPSAVMDPGTWIRPIGCDIPAGSVVLPKGHGIDPIALGLLMQSGADHIVVKRPLVVGVLSTGNELILGNKEESARSSGKIPDVNRPILLNMLSTFGPYCQTMDLGNERDDDVQAMAKTIDSALAKCDVVITTGGISMGETDIVEQVLMEHCGGNLHFGRMNMKPGKPTTFVTIKKEDAIRLVFAMPGNPVSATVCTQLLVKPCLDLLFHGVPEDVIRSSEGISENLLERIVDHSWVHPEVHAILAQDIKLDHQRPEYHRITLQKTSNNSYLAQTTGVQRSSRLMSCRDAQALVLLPAATPSKPKALQGEMYPVLLFDSLRGDNRIQLQHSLHLGQRGGDFRVSVVEVLPKDFAHLSKLEDTSLRVQQALSGSKSGTARIVSRRIYSDALDSLYAAIVDSNDADVIVVDCVPFQGSFTFHLDVVAELRKRLTKPANSLALQARQGVAAEDPKSALFEVIAGYAPEHKGAMVICLPQSGIGGGLANVRGLLKHALNVARNKPHNHHHTHRHHDHQEGSR